MLSRTQLAELYRDLNDREVLSVYADGTATDFAERKAWRTRLDQGLSAARDALLEEGRDTGDFDRAAERLRPPLDEMDTFLPDKGWVAFVTPEKAWYHRPVRVPMPDLVRWERGLRVAPYVRALKQQRVVVAVLLDSRRARIFKYLDGVLGEPENLTTAMMVGDLDLNTSKRAQIRSGVRGKTATDAAQRYLEVSEERLLKRLMETVSDMAGSDGLLILGGPSEALAHARTLVSPSIASRTGTVQSGHVDMTLAEVRAAVEEAATRTTRAMQATLLEDVVDSARARGKATLGLPDTEQALRDGRVDLLLLSRGFIGRHPDLADHMVGTAFDQQAELEELSGEGGERLDREADGVVARVRYTLGVPVESR